MANRSIFCKTAIATSLLTVILNTHTAQAAIRTDRLSPGQLRVWNSIKEIVFEKDSCELLLHPRLHELWQAAENSDHLIFVELGKHAKDAPTKAGEMTIEKADPVGAQHIIIVHLFLSTINRAFADNGLPQGADQFAPLAGLNRKARYAEVLGHELAHVERVLHDADYLGLYTELDRELASYSSICKSHHGRAQGAQKQLERIDSLVSEIEGPALAAEAEIWRELVSGKGGSNGVRP
jgi:hypothetical protein